MFFQILIILFITLLVYYIRYYYLYFTYWQRQNIKAIPFISFGWALNEFHCWSWNCSQKYGKIYGGYNFRDRVLIINDAKIARDISIKELHKFPKRILGYLGTTSLIHSLFFMDVNEDWKRVRSIVSPTFTSGKLKGMLTPINRIVQNFIKHLDKFSQSGEQFDVKDFTSAFTLDVISACAFGIEIDSFSQPDHPIVTNARKILGVNASFSFIISFAFPFIGRVFGFEPFEYNGCKYFDDLTFKIIEQRLKKQNNKVQQKDLIGLMMEQSSLQNGGTINDDIKQKLKGISREEIAGQGVIFFLAGFDTTNATFCHVIYCLIKNPEWQDKLFDEVKKQESLNDYETLKKLPILNAIINETLRMHPPLLTIHRSTDRDTPLLDTGIIVPANTSIIFHTHVIHRNPEYFPDPDSFKPDRFLDENSAESNPAFMPFGVGPRLCVGMRFALNELRIAVAHLVLNYELLPNPNLKLNYYHGNMLLSPKKLICSIKKRI